MEWKFSKRGRSCDECRKEFGPEDFVFSAILDDGEMLVRRDLCEGCWGPGKDVFSFWRHKIAPPTEARLADRMALMTIFRNLSDADTDRKRDFRYVLALALMRRRALKPFSTRREDGREIWVLRHPRDESRHEVEVRPITGERIESLVSEITQVISVPGAAPADAEPAPEAVKEEGSQ